MQNLVILIDPRPKIGFHFEFSFKAANMCFNRFTIDENAAFELSGVYYFHEWNKWDIRDVKGKEF